MTNAKRQSTEFLNCNHCGNHAPMEIVAEYFFSKNRFYDNDPWSEYYDAFGSNEGYKYELLFCQACQEVTLRKYFNADYLDPEKITIKTLYPAASSRLLGLPYQIQQAYEIAIKVRVIDANAYAVIIGRILEMVCEDRKAIGKDLYHKLNDLATKDEIPKKLIGVANSLRQLRNFGAHVSLGELTRD